MIQLDTITWYLLLCCVVAGSASGWMLYYVIYEMKQPNIGTLSIPVVGIGMSATIMILSEKHRRKRVELYDG